MTPKTRSTSASPSTASSSPLLRHPGIRASGQHAAATHVVAGQPRPGPPGAFPTTTATAARHRPAWSPNGVGLRLDYQMGMVRGRRWGDAGVGNEQDPWVRATLRRLPITVDVHAPTHEGKPGYGFVGCRHLKRALARSRAR